MKKQLGNSKISLNEIELFLTVAQAKSISSAARDLFLSQSALSIKMQGLENTLGVTLFKRTSHGVSLTEDGVRLYSKLYQSYHQFRASSDRALYFEEGNNVPDLSIGGLQMLGTNFAMQCIASEYSKQTGKTNIFQQFYHYQYLPSMLYCDAIDIAITMSFYSERKRSLNSKRLFPMNQSLLLPAQWNITELNDETRKFLSEQTLLIELHNGIDILSNALIANGIHHGKVEFCFSFLEMLNKISTGAGYTTWEPWLPTIYYNQDSISVIEFPNQDFEAPYISMAWKKDKVNDEKTNKIINIVNGINFKVKDFELLRKAVMADTNNSW